VVRCSRAAHVAACRAHEEVRNVSPRLVVCACVYVCVRVCVCVFGGEAAATYRIMGVCGWCCGNGAAVL